MRATRSARAALLAAVLLLGATSAPAYDMETGIGPGAPGAIPRTRDPAMVRSVEVRVEPLAGPARPAGSFGVSQGDRQPKPYAPAKSAKKIGKKGKKGGKNAAKKSAAKDPGVRLGSVTDGSDPVLAKP